ncbi:MAG TPA: hypothetical protein PK566_03555 [Pseudobacteroides sp.]|nr:hypothetical protein [Pseudobacteroides sp.]
MYTNYFYPPNFNQCPYANSMAIRNDNFRLTRASGDIDIEFQTNENGDFVKSISVYGAGYTVNVDGYIIYPDDIYTIEISSSDGGGGYFTGLRANQHITCKIETSLWHKTTIRVKLHSSKPNIKGQAHIHYNT